MTNFIHQHTAHCESGVVSSLLVNNGLDLNEAMVFGLASGITFAYIPFVKLAGMPLIAYRMPPGSIIKNVFKRLNIPLTMMRFSSSTKGMQALETALSQNKLVGLQTSVYWLPYFPEEMRFHFNAHNILVYGKDEASGEYLISDPVFEVTMRAGYTQLEQARFAKGALASKGRMYSIDENAIPKEIDFPKIIHKAIKKTTKIMRAPVPIAGVRGIRYLANNILKLKNSSKDLRYRKLYLGHIVRMQEEIGTGGAGFRYMYAYFLEQAADICKVSAFKEAALMLTDIGDQWRLFASNTVRQCRDLNEESYDLLADNLNHIADEEQKLWQFLEKANKSMPLS